MKIYNRISALVERNPLFKNPFFLFLPFLVLFIILVVINQHKPMGADSYVYMMFAENILNGFYSPPAPNINLIESPGLPLILVPFVALKLPILSILLMNALFLYLSIVFLFKSLHLFLPYYKALIFTTLYASCYSSYYLLSSVYTEPLSMFLISILVFYIIKSYHTDNKKYSFVAGFVLGYMALVKVIFPYVVLVMLIYFSIYFIINRSMNSKKGLIISSLAFLVILPYMVYTYNLTGKLFYFGSAGNDTFYWMSTPHEYEYGSWNNSKFEANADGPEKQLGTELLKANHQKNFDRIAQLPPLEKDDAFLEMAIDNIKKHPVKYLKNCVSNVSRLFFSFPKNYTFEVPIYKVWYFSIIYVLLLYSLFITLFKWKSINYSIQVVCILSFIYLGGSTVVSVDNRQLLIIMPALILWIGYIFHKTVEIKAFDRGTDSTI